MKSAKNVSRHKQITFVWKNPQRVRKINTGNTMSLMLSSIKELVDRTSSRIPYHDHYICWSFILLVFWLDCLTSTAELWQKSSAMDFSFDWEVFRVRLPVGLGLGEARWMTDEVKHWASTCLCSFVTLCGSGIDQASVLKSSSQKSFQSAFIFHRFHQQSASWLTVPGCSETHRLLSKTASYQHFDALKEEQKLATAAFCQWTILNVNLAQIIEHSR